MTALNYVDIFLYTRNNLKTVFHHVTDYINIFSHMKGQIIIPGILKYKSVAFGKQVPLQMHLLIF